MLDRDLAELYGVETRVLNQSVKRNANRFPEDFMFQLTKEECLRSQIVTLKEKRARHWLSCSPESRSHGGVSDLFEMRRERKWKIGDSEWSTLQSDFVDNSTGSHDVKERFLVSGLPF